MDIRKKVDDKFFVKLRKSDYIGVEIEMPLINTINPFKVDMEIIQILFKKLLENDFKVSGIDNDGNVIAIKNKKNGDTISLEYSVNTLEFSLNKEHSIWELRNKFNKYYNFINDFLKGFNYRLCADGINPNYKYIDMKCLNQDRYKAIERLLVDDNGDLFSRFCSYCCSIQTHINSSRRELVNVINMFTSVEDIKSKMFANSYMEETRLKNSRKYLWENSNFGVLNTGKNKIYESIDDLKDDYLNRNMFFVERDNKFLILKDRCSVNKFYSQDKLEVIDELGNEYRIIPDINDFDNFRSYKSVELTKYGTLEIRTDCMQKLENIFKVVALNVGISLCSKEILNYIGENNEISPEKLIDFAIVGLKKRGYSEEKIFEVEV